MNRLLLIVALLAASRADAQGLLKKRPAEPVKAAAKLGNPPVLAVKAAHYRVPDWLVSFMDVAESLKLREIPEKGASLQKLPAAAPEQTTSPRPRVEPNANTVITFDTWPDAEIWLAVNPAKFPQATSREGLPYRDRAWLSLGKVTEWRTRVSGVSEMYLAASRSDGTWTGAMRVMVTAGESKTVRAR